MFSLTKDGKKILYVLTEDDAQDMAHHLGFDALTDDQLYMVRKSVEWGFGESGWDVILKTAVKMAKEESA